MKTFGPNTHHFWDGVPEQVTFHKWKPAWDCHLLAYIIHQHTQHIPTHILLDVIQSSTSNNINDWIREAAQKLEHAQTTTQH